MALLRSEHTLKNRLVHLYRVTCIHVQALTSVGANEVEAKDSIVFALFTDQLAQAESRGLFVHAIMCSSSGITISVTIGRFAVALTCFCCSPPVRRAVRSL